LSMDLQQISWLREGPAKSFLVPGCPKRQGLLK
jgi:hypothetical protein